MSTRRTGRLGTDEGIPLRHQFPPLNHAAEQGAKPRIDGPFTNSGLAALAGLEGVVELDLLWHVKA